MEGIIGELHPFGVDSDRLEKWFGAAQTQVASDKTKKVIKL